MRTVVLWLVVSLAACTRSQQTSSDKYWWLGLKKSPFGGRNYNSDEIQRGEHIPQGTKFNGKGGKSDKTAQRSVKQISKRQAEGEGDSEEVFQEEEQENEIQLNEIDTECPRRTTCVERFFCDKFSGKNAFDQIPCLLNTGEFAGDFGICCESPFNKVCPKVPVLPDPKSCLPRPLGDPEDDECSNIGSRSSCSEGSLCCFNGCLNVCLEEPPYSVQKAFFFRQKAIIVGGGPRNSPQPKNPSKGGGSEFGSAELESSAEPVLSGEAVSNRDFIPEKNEKSPKLRTDSDIMSRVLKQLLQRLRDRIS